MIRRTRHAPNLMGYEIASASQRAIHSPLFTELLENYMGEPYRRGGDDYGVLKDHECVAAFIYDGTGKHIEHSLFQLVADLRRGLEGYDPGTILTLLNQGIYNYNEKNGRMVSGTAVLTTLFSDGRVKISIAAHEIPAILRRGEQQLDDHKSDCSGFMLGLFEEAVYRTEEIKLGSGDILFLFTDGIADARKFGQTGGYEFYGERQMREDILAMKDEKLNDIAKGLLRKSLVFADRRYPSDDATSLIIRKL